ncbi:hypothetical protein DVH24_009504 [Malus domestica]|uniref:Uncharacterized protein n=1 Tax=Malus domestica TaxID=3750 RepID=A0A498IW81_MALDO|nr:hypothetical protein DVH24_009504 [Malus domestica]
MALTVGHPRPPHPHSHPLFRDLPHHFLLFLPLQLPLAPPLSLHHIHVPYVVAFFAATLFVVKLCCVSEGNLDYECLRTELRRMAPTNGRAVLLFQGEEDDVTAAENENVGLGGGDVGVGRTWKMDLALKPRQHLTKKELTDNWQKV